MIRPEDALTIACADWVKLMRKTDQRYELVFSVQNERKTSPRMGRMWNRRGRRKGVSDWIILCPSKSGKYCGGCIELKAGKNKPTAAQRDFLDIAYAHGNYCAVVRSFDAFREVLTQYMGAL